MSFLNGAGYFLRYFPSTRQHNRSGVYYFRFRSLKSRVAGRGARDAEEHTYVVLSRSRLTFEGFL